MSRDNNLAIKSGDKVYIFYKPTHRVASYTNEFKYKSRSNLSHDIKTHSWEKDTSPFERLRYECRRCNASLVLQQPGAFKEGSVWNLYIPTYNFDCQVSEEEHLCKDIIL